MTRKRLGLIIPSVVIKVKTGLKSFRDEPIEFLLVSKVLQRQIRDFKIAYYGWL